MKMTKLIALTVAQVVFWGAGSLAFSTTTFAEDKNPHHALQKQQLGERQELQQKHQQERQELRSETQKSLKEKKAERKEKAKERRQKKRHKHQSDQQEGS